MHHSKSLNYMPGLDGLRALAVLAVIAYHMGYKWALGGLLGVNLFFVLSGYLITNNLFSQWYLNGKINLKQFWIRRAKRLLPALFLMMSSIIIVTAVINPSNIKALKGEILAVSFYVENWYLIFRQVSYFESFGPPSPLGHLWSLAIEEQFYIIWPLILTLLFKVFKKERNIVAVTVLMSVISALAMAFIYVPGLDPSRVYYGTDTRAFALLLGSVAAMLWPRSAMKDQLSQSKKSWINISGVMCLIIVILITIKTNQYQPFMYRGGLFAFSILATLLIVLIAHPSSAIGKLLGIYPLRLIGKWSYGIYLWHYPVIVMTSPAINTDEPNVFLSLIQVAISLILAALSYYIIEEPILNNRKSRFAMSFRAVFCLLIIIAMTTGTSTSIEGIQILAEESQPPVQQIKPPVQQALENVDLANSNINGKDITIISDSLLIDAKALIEEELSGITIDTKKGRQMYDAPETIEELNRKEKIGKVVIIALGSNGAFTEKQLIKTIDCLSDVESILLVNTRVPRPWENVVNETIEKVAKDYQKVQLVSWYDESKGHNEYFYQDGIHLNKEGMSAYLEMILKALGT